MAKTLVDGKPVARGTSAPTATEAPSTELHYTATKRSTDSSNYVTFGPINALPSGKWPFLMGRGGVLYIEKTTGPAKADEVEILIRVKK